MMTADCCEVSMSMVLATGMLSRWTTTYSCTTRSAAAAADDIVLLGNTH